MNCWACDKSLESETNFGIPIYEDVILHNKYEGEWGGVPSCQTCYDKQQVLDRPMQKSEFIKAWTVFARQPIDWSRPDAVMRRALQIGASHV